MSGDDGFLARWSRRKRSAVARNRGPAKPQPPIVATDVAAPNIPDAPVARDASAAIAEPLSLPPIESLGPASDITRFLAPGVPAELTRQALRRAWRTDPAIRDFVGPSENAWDFTASDGVPGFGPLAAEDIRRLLDAVTVDPQPGDPPPVEPSAAPAAEAESAIAETGTETPVVATEHQPDRQQCRAPVPGRRHGSALPR